MNDNTVIRDLWPVQRFCELSRQFDEAYRAYAHRPSQQHSHDRLPDEVELFLVCHALELALKGWLWLRAPSITEKELQSSYGHKLVKLANDVLPYYPNIQPYLPLIKALGHNAEVNEPFSHRSYGYPDIKDKGYPAPADIEPFAEFVSQCRFDLFLTFERECPQE